jgi:hypothetical protein
MRDIKPVVDFLQAHRMQQVDVLTNEDNESRYAAFFEKVSQQELKTDTEAAAYLFNSTPSAPRFRKFKSLFKKKLLNTLLFVNEEHPRFPPHSRAIIQLEREHCAIQLLQHFGLLRIASRMAEKLLIRARKYEATSICKSLLKIVKHECANVDGDEKKYAELQQEFQAFYALEQAENLALGYYEDIRLKFIATSLSRRELGKQALTYGKQLAPMLSNYESCFFHFYTRLVQASAHLLHRDYASVINVCQSGIEFFKSKPFEYHRGLTTLRSFILIGCIQLKQYDTGWQVSEESLKLHKPGTRNWFNTLRIQVHLALHCKEYSKAFDLFASARKHRKFQTLPERDQQVWNIYEAYLYFLLSINQVTGKSVEDLQAINRFRFQKFLNSTATVQQDKKGYNIAILIAQVLILIADDKHLKAIDRIEAISMYCYRHLHKDNDLYRANCFLKALLELPKSGFHHAAAVRKAKAHLKKLSDHGTERAVYNHEVEILPFEDAWSLLIEQLKP